MGLLRYIRRFRAVISLEGSPYLTRYRLWPRPRWSYYLHHILRSDRDRNLHDHPFDFYTVILWGGYWEHTGHEYESLNHATGQMEKRLHVVRKWRGVGTVIKHWAEDAHRLELPPGRTAWTFFIRGPRRREWGFHTDAGWVQWDEYEKLGEMTGREQS